MTLIVRVNMFTATQMAYVTGFGGEVKKTFTIGTDRLDKDIINICENEDIYNVVISGPMMYTKGFEKKIRQAELAKYNQHKLDIQLIK